MKTINKLRNRIADCLFSLGRRLRRYEHSTLVPSTHYEYIAYMPEELLYYCSKPWFEDVIEILNFRRRGYCYRGENLMDKLFRDFGYGNILKHWTYVVYKFFDEIEDVLEYDGECTKSEGRSPHIILLIQNINSPDSAYLAFKAWLDEDDPHSAYRTLQKEVYELDHPHRIMPQKDEENNEKTIDLPF